MNTNKTNLRLNINLTGLVKLLDCVLAIDDKDPDKRILLDSMINILAYASAEGAPNNRKKLALNTINKYEEKLKGFKSAIEEKRKQIENKPKKGNKKTARTPKKSVNNKPANNKPANTNNKPANTNNKPANTNNKSAKKL